MAEPQIAILGSVDRRRGNLSCKICKSRAREPRRSAQNLRIWIQASYPTTSKAEFSKVLMVCGYVRSGVIKRTSIQVHLLQLQTGRRHCRAAQIQ